MNALIWLVPVAIALGADGAEFVDSWHQPEPMACADVGGAPGLFQVRGAYGPDAAWGWRIALVHREPTGELVCANAEDVAAAIAKARAGRHLRSGKRYGGADATVEAGGLVKGDVVGAFGHDETRWIGPSGERGR